MKEVKNKDIQEKKGKVGVILFTPEIWILFHRKNPKKGGFLCANCS
jgi:hypothetical protein